GVPLHQPPAPAPSRSPHVPLLHLPPLHPPQPRPDQPLPQRLLAHLHLVVLGQVLAGQRGPEVAVLCLHQLQRFGAHAFRQAPVRHPPPPPDAPRPGRLPSSPVAAALSPSDRSPPTAAPPPVASNASASPHAKSSADPDPSCLTSTSPVCSSGQFAGFEQELSTLLE